MTYRDRPNATVDTSSAEPDAGGAANGDASAAADTTSDSASADRDIADAAADGTTPDGTTSSDDSPRSNGSFANPDAPGYDDAPIRSTAYDLPGFGPVGTLVAMAVATLIAARRRDHER